MNIDQREKMVKELQRATLQYMKKDGIPDDIMISLLIQFIGNNNLSKEYLEYLKTL